MSTTLIWLRRDLRLRDHPALRAAYDTADRVVPVFCFDDRLLHGRHASGSRTQFLLECLKDLDRSLKDRGSALVVRRGDPARELPNLAGALGAGSIHHTVDVGPFARERDRRVLTKLEDQGTKACPHPGLFVVDDLAEIRTAAANPYSVFTPFYRSWARTERRRVLRPPARLAKPGVDPGSIPTLDELGHIGEAEDPAPGGETAGREAMTRFLKRVVVNYEHLAEPWTMPDEVQHSTGCVIGKDYPKPIVDHANARREALARYGDARSARL